MSLIEKDWKSINEKMRKWYALISQIVSILYKTGTGWWGQVIKKVRNNQEECDPLLAENILTGIVVTENETFCAALHEYVIFWKLDGTNYDVSHY